MRTACSVLLVFVAAAGYFVAPFVQRLVRIPRQLVPPEAKRPDALRVGVLGAAAIAPFALVYPAWKTDAVVVSAVAARSRQRAAAFAEKYGIPKVHESYEALVHDPELDAVYIPLPNGLHREWAVKAMRAGKHVLCEKPMASNKEEAEEMRAVAHETNRVLMEAFHYRFHPLAQRMESIVRSGQLGRVTRIETEGALPSFGFPATDIRYSNEGKEPKLAGGASMDIGCYAVNCFRMLAAAAGQPEVTVVAASALEIFPQVDSRMVANVTAGDISGSIIAAFDLPAYELFHARARVVGDKGEMLVENFIAPFVYHSLTVRPAEGPAFVEKHYDAEDRTTYELQLSAFARAVAAGAHGDVAGSAEDAVGNMAVIDGLYRAAGWQPRRGY